MSRLLSCATWLLLATSLFAAEPRHTDADYERHLVELRKRMPEGFHAVIEKPFVVVGDGSPRSVERHAAQTVRWAVTKLKQDYFSDDPAVILDVWLFHGAESYEKHVTELFGKKPATPYGYYSRKDRALIMNIETGTGTLVHEIVHPFIEANFPKCPAWFNEGLASLYEEYGERNGRIIGRPNWRLPGLQAAISKGRLPPFETLCATTTHEFYADKQGVNYAQARYLCYYLQEQGLLRKFYHDFRNKAADDSSGYAALQKVLGDPDMERFQRGWEKFVVDLKRD